MEPSNKMVSKEGLWRGAAIFAAMAYVISIGLTRPGSIYAKMVQLFLVILALVHGKRLGVPVRLFITAEFFLWTFLVCLVARTTAPGLTLRNTSTALLYGTVWGFLPAMSVLRLWELKRAILFLELLLPVSFLLAAGIASVEEYVFAQKYRDTGIGRTRRWTVRSHWLAYDREHDRLYGPWSEPPQYK